VNQRGAIEIGAILVLLAIGAAIGIVNFPAKPIVKEKIVVVEKPVIVELIKEVAVPCPTQDKAWWEIWK